MNYIYDILLNYKKDLQDFYEWNNGDQIEHIRKIPLFRIPKETIILITNNNIKIDSEIKNKLFQKTEMFNNKKISTIPYACLISDAEIVIALKFNDCGIIISRSRLLIDEESEVNEMCQQLENSEFKFTTLKRNEIPHFLTSNEKEKKEFIVKAIEEMYRKGYLEKIKYLYYECYNKREENIERAILKIKTSIDKDWDKICTRILNFIKLTSTSY